MEQILGVKIVRKSSKEDQDNACVTDDLGMIEWSPECAVCYSLHLTDEEEKQELPDITCDQCRRVFHLTCLYDVSMAAFHSLMLGKLIIN